MSVSHTEPTPEPRELTEILGEVPSQIINRTVSVAQIAAGGYCLYKYFEADKRTWRQPIRLIGGAYMVSLGLNHLGTVCLDARELRQEMREQIKNRIGLH